MATDAELQRLRELAGTPYPVPAEGEPQGWTDDQLRIYLDAEPSCDLQTADVYGAAARLWLDKAERVELEQVEQGGQAPLVTQARQGSASLTFATPTPAGTSAALPNDPRAMRAMAARLRSRSCHGGFRTADVAPSPVVTRGPRDSPNYRDPAWQEPHLIDLAAERQRTVVVNLPEPD